GSAAIGIARLRVIDLVTGDQPISNEDGTVHVALNGEVYGFAALRAHLERGGHRFRTASDTEVIVHAWEEYGEHCPDHLNGMFGFALWDRRRQVLFLARDRMGEKPLYYAKVDGWFVFGSELRAVLAHVLGRLRRALARRARLRPSGGRAPGHRARGIAGLGGGRGACARAPRRAARRADLRHELRAALSLVALRAAQGHGRPHRRRGRRAVRRLSGDGRRLVASRLRAPAAGRAPWAGVAGRCA